MAQGIARLPERRLGRRRTLPCTHGCGARFRRSVARPPTPRSVTTPARRRRSRGAFGASTGEHVARTHAPSATRCSPSRSSQRSDERAARRHESLVRSSLRFHLERCGRSGAVIGHTGRYDCEPREKIAGCSAARRCDARGKLRPAERRQHRTRCSRALRTMSKRRAPRPTMNFVSAARLRERSAARLADVRPLRYEHPSGRWTSTSTRSRRAPRRSSGRA